MFVDCLFPFFDRWNFFKFLFRDLNQHLPVHTSFWLSQQPMAPIAWQPCFILSDPFLPVIAGGWEVGTWPKNSFSVGWPAASAYSAVWHSGRDVVIRTKFLFLKENSGAGSGKNIPEKELES